MGTPTNGGCPVVTGILTVGNSVNPPDLGRFVDPSGRGMLIWGGSFCTVDPPDLGEGDGEEPDSDGNSPTVNGIHGAGEEVEIGVPSFKGVSGLGNRTM